MNYKKQWSLEEDVKTKDADIIPLDDIYEHFYGLECHCAPKKDYEFKKLIIHNSYDDREEFEKLNINASIN